MRQAHAIETLTWHALGSDDREAARAHQARLSAFLNGPGRATIARVFSRLSVPGEVWQIERLEIDTGPMPADGSFGQWSAILERQLADALHHTLHSARHGQRGGGMRADAAALAGMAPRPADHQRLEHFLFYLRHGHLPWSRSAMAGRGLSAWLATLARRTGPRLWSLLRALRPADYVLARLSQITPYQGLQALVAIRHRELAESLDMLDAQILAPLQARGRLSAYQVQQLQQAWRVAAFRTLWDRHAGHLGADGIQRLRRELGAALARQLGQGGLGAWRPARRQPPGRANDAALAPLLFAGVIDTVAPGAMLAPVPARLAPGMPGGAPEHARRPLDAALERLGTALDGSVPLDGAALEVLLQDLYRREPDVLRARLRGLVLRDGQAEQWLARHGAPLTGRVLRALAPRDDAARGASLGVHWAESLRQFALAALARPAGVGRAARPGGVSALQAWLAAYSLRQLALGERAPTDQRGWERLWQRALRAWQPDHRPSRRPAASVASAAAAVSSAPIQAVPGPQAVQAMQGSTARPATYAPQTPRALAGRLDWDAIHRIASRTLRIAHLLALPQRPAARRDWMVRRQATSWLADPALCADWIAVTRPTQRWALLGVLFPRELGTLREASAALAQTAALLGPDLSAAARARSHWRFLAHHVLVEQRPITAASLARRHALYLYREHGHGAGALGQWLRRVAQASARPEAPEATPPLAPPVKLAKLGQWGRLGRWWRRGHAAPASLPAPVLPAGAIRALHAAPTETEQWEARQPLDWPLPPSTRNSPVADRPTPPAPARPEAAVLAELAALEAAIATGTHYVSDAGLVLLANYSQQLFRMLDLLDGPRLRDARAASKAVRCLAWLAHGHDDASEPECILPKLLCGMPLGEPLSAPAEGPTWLDTETRAVLDSLLGAVIAHWKTIGQTSPDGLRETFLRREGRLVREEAAAGTHWRLVVRPAPFDMLLDRLPWSYATIKLPWMQEALYVDWR